MTGSPSSGSDPLGEARAWLSGHGVQVAVGGGHADSAAPERRAGSAPGERRPRPSASHRRAGSAGDADADAAGAGSEADPEGVARTIALRSLTSQARSRHELEQSLAARHVPEEAAQTVLDRLADAGLVDDARFARDWVESRQWRRLLSGRALRCELQTKGIDKETVDAALAEVAVDDEMALARDLARRKLKSMDGLSRQVKVRRLAAALARRGFTADVVGRTIDELMRLDLD